MGSRNDFQVCQIANEGSFTTAGLWYVAMP
jgi:hypothetical protein